MGGVKLSIGKILLFALDGTAPLAICHFGSRSQEGSASPIESKAECFLESLWTFCSREFLFAVRENDRPPCSLDIIPTRLFQPCLSSVLSFLRFPLSVN